MSKILTILLLSIAFSAKAEVKTKIDAVSNLSFDGKSLEVEYKIGGGCQPHTPQFDLIVEPSASFNTVNLRVELYDVSPEFDPCEAFLTVKGSVNLQNKVKELEKTLDTNVYYGEFLLPKLQVYTYDIF